MGSPVLRYRHLILLHTQLRNGCRYLPTICEWPAKFGPYAPRYQPCYGERWVSTQANQEPKSSPVPKPIGGKEAYTATKKRPTIPKYRSVSAIRDFPPIPERFKPYLSDERKRAMHAHLTQISDEYARMELEEIRLLKIGALPEGSKRQRTAFLSSINKDYEALVKDEEDPSEGSSEE
jgi:hypothetical protein